MAEYIPGNSTDVTQDIESCQYKQVGPLITDDSEISSRDYGNISQLQNVEVNLTTSSSSSSQGSSKLVLTVYGNDLRIKQPSKLGNVYSFLFINGNPLIILGPQFFMSIILFIIVNFLNALLIYFVYQELYFILKYIGLMIYVIQVFSQISCTLINPGIPHRNNYVSDSIMHTIYQNIKHNNTKFDKYRVCKRCNILVTLEQQVTHCEDCNICVEDMDHHCVWIGKCIAKRNLWLFNLFIISTASFVIFSIVSLIGLVIVNVSRS